LFDHQFGSNAHSKKNRRKIIKQHGNKDAMQSDSDQSTDNSQIESSHTNKNQSVFEIHSTI